ncbi:hypothetical protein D3C83_224240 [compost metagenome]
MLEVPCGFAGTVGCAVAGQDREIGWNHDRRINECVGEASAAPAKLFEKKC